MWQSFLWQVLIAIVVVVLFTPKPKGPKAATLDDFDFPTAEEGRTIPLVIGTREISGPNVVWYGDLRVLKVSSGKK